MPIYQILTTRLNPSDEFEWKTIITAIEDIEGNGCFPLLSKSKNEILWD